MFANVQLVQAEQTDDNDAAVTPVSLSLFAAERHEQLSDSASSSSRLPDHVQIQTGLG